MAGITMTSDGCYSDLLKDLREQDLLTGEKHRKLNQFVKFKVEKEADPKSLIASIPPTDFWSRKLRLDIAERFRSAEIILEVLKSDERAFINRILTFPWLFEDDSLLADHQFLTSQLFPKISCLCRKKIIRRLSNHLEDEQKSEHIFEAVEALYGVEDAQSLLPCCGSEFMSSVLSTRKLQLNNRQLLLILNKFPEVGIKYLERFFESKQGKGQSITYIARQSNIRRHGMDSYSSSGLYNRTLSFLAAEDCLQFMNIYERFSEVISGLGLSSRAANRLLKFNVQRILEKPKIYSVILNKEFLQKRLKSDQFLVFFKGVLPDMIQYFRRNISDLLLWVSSFPSTKKGEILRNGFEQKYSQKLMERVDCIASDIVHYLLPEERMKIACYKLTQDTSEDNEIIDYYESAPRHYESFWTAFKPIDLSIPLIKEFIYMESDSSLRSEMIVQLVRSCSINSDKGALAEVAKYVLLRHRNENVQVHVDFLEAVDQNFDLLELGAPHWDSLREIIQLCLFTGDLTRYSFVLNDILEKAFVYFVKENLPLKSILPSLIQMKNDITWGSDWRMETLRKSEYKSFEKLFLEMTAQELESKYSAEDPYVDPKKVKSILTLANCFTEWNKSTSAEALGKLTLQNFPWLLDRIIELLDSDDPSDVSTASQILLSDQFLERPKYMDLIFDVNPIERCVMYFLRREPKKVSDKIDYLMKHILKTNLKLYKWLFRSIRCYGPSTLVSKIVAICEKTAQDPGESIQERGNCIIVLSYLQSSSEFLTFVEKYYPTSSKIDVDQEDSETNLQLIKSVLNSLKNIEVPSAGFPTLLKLCTGDYLKYSLGALNSLCLNSAVTKGVPFLNQLIDRPVSVQKHAIRLLCSLSTREQVSQLMLKLWNIDQNASIKQEIVKHTFKIISSSASQLFVWEFLKTAILSLKPKDKACLSEISRYENIDKVPSVFLSDYFRLCKEVYSQDKVDKALKISILQCIDCFKHRLSDEFFEELINSELFLRDQENLVQQQFIFLTNSYLLSSSENVQSICLKVIENKFSRLTGPNLTSIFFGQGKSKDNSRKILSYFIEDLCKLSFDKSYEDRNYSPLFSQLQQSDFFIKHQTETFGTYLFLRFAQIFHFCGKDLEEAGKQIGDLLDFYVSLRGKEIIGLYNLQLHAFLQVCYKSKCTTTEQVLQIIRGLLLSPLPPNTDSGPREIIASQMFPSTCPPGNVEETYKSLANELLKSKENVVHMYAYNCIKL